jgi:hypothetical protein
MTQEEINQLVKDECIKFAAEVAIRFGNPDDQNMEIPQKAYDDCKYYYENNYNISAKVLALENK